MKRACKGCGAELRREMFVSTSMLQRSKFCGMPCYRSSLKTSTVHPAPYGPIAALVMKNGVSLISLQDVPLVQGWQWEVDSLGYVGGIRGRLHRLIMKPREGLVVDHINRDKLDNRRENLRVVSQRENVRNHGLARTNTSGACGVRRRVGPKGERFHVMLNVGGKQIWVGSFGTMADAITARAASEKRYWR